MKRVIVPLDGSVLSEHAIPLAAFLAKTLDRELEFVHAIEHPIRDDTPDRMIEPDPATVKQGLLEVAGRYDLAMPAHFSVFVGDPVVRLLRMSERDPDTIIVMATHGRGGFGRMLLGSVADKVVRGAAGPVVLVRPALSEPETFKGLDKLLIPLDGSALAEGVLSHGVELARRTGASLHLVRVVESLWSLAYPTSPYDGAAPDPQVIQDLDEQVKEDARAYLDDMGSRLRAEGIEVTWEVATGRAVDEILFSAGELPADLILTTTHGRGGLSRVFQGSVATSLMTHSTVPLLVLPASSIGVPDATRFEPGDVTLLSE
jgi:nucleotide-binding universal stress UspA family protein